MITTPTPVKESISKRMMAGYKVPQLNQDETTELTFRVQSLLINHFGTGGFVVEETMAMLNEPLLLALQNDWQDAVKGGGALLKQNQHYMTLLGALLFGIEAGARPRFDPNGTLEYQILSVVQHLQYEMRPHDWSSIGAPHNWTFYLALLQNVICIANASQLAKHYDMNQQQELYSVKERFLEDALKVYGTEQMLEACINDYTGMQVERDLRIKQQERKGIEELTALEALRNKLNRENDDTIEEIQKFKLTGNQIDELVRRQELIQDQVLSAKNQLVAQNTENDTAKQMLQKVKEELQIVVNQLNLIHDKLTNQQYSLEQSIELHKQLEEMNEANKRAQAQLNTEKIELQKLSTLQRNYLPHYRRALKLLLETVDGCRLKEGLNYPDEVVEIINWAQQEEITLKQLDSIDEHSTDAVDFETLKLFLDNLRCIALPAAERVINEVKQKNMQYQNTLAQVSQAFHQIQEAALNYQSEIIKKEKMRQQEANQAQEFKSKNASQLGTLHAKNEEYEKTITNEELEAKETKKAVENMKDAERHAEMEIEMMVREIEMLQKRHSREIEIGQNAAEQLYQFVISEWDDQYQHQLNQITKILELFTTLGPEAIKTSETWLLKNGFSREWIEKLVPEFKKDNFS